MNFLRAIFNRGWGRLVPTNHERDVHAPYPFFPHSLRLITLLAACLLTSCIECREEIWLEADGSGRADVSYSLPAAAARFQGGAEGVRKLIGKFLAEAKGLKSPQHEVVAEGDRLRIQVQAGFDSALDLKNLSSGGAMTRLPSSAADLAGRVEVKLSGRTVDFTRTISPGSALPGVGFMPASAFDGRKLVYIIHLPMAAKESNATRIEDGGRTLVWDFPLASAVKAPVTTRFRADVPIPLWLAIAVGSAFLAGGWLVLCVVRKIRRRKISVAP